MSDKVYAFRYTYCIYESAAFTMSLHKTKAGAFKAMNTFLNNRFNGKRNDVLLLGKPHLEVRDLYDHVFTGERADVVEMDVFD